MSKKSDEIKELAEFIYVDSSFLGYEEDALQLAEELYKAGYRKQNDVVDEFANRLKEAPIKFGVPLLGLSTKKEIEDYFDGIMLQVRDAIGGIAEEMKGGKRYGRN